MAVSWDKLATELAPDLCSTGKIDQIKIQFYFSVFSQCRAMLEEWFSNWDKKATNGAPMEALA